MLPVVNSASSESAMECRIGIMGGAFDPIHIGHLYCAEQALVARNMDYVIFVPTGLPSFKRDKKLAPIKDRLEMCKLATMSNAKFFVSDIEADETYISYTVNTLRRFKEIYPKGIEFDFIIGSDCLPTIPSWYKSEELAKLCTFVCVSREETNINGTSMYLREKGFNVEIVETSSLDISSSDIRRRINCGQSIRYIVPMSVCDYIFSKNLYNFAVE